MREQVLSNIINFVTNNDITEVDHLDHIMVDSCLTVSDDVINTNSMNLIWLNISKGLKLDNISIHLLENFSDAMDWEDYISASKMKIEILNRWGNLTEDDFWEMGRAYLFHLKEGFKESRVLRYLYESIKEVEHVWVSRKFKQLNFIIEELDVINCNVSSHSPQELWDEVVLTIEDDSNITHPLLMIEDVIELFKLFKTDENE
jgi:hypothetical protein